MNKRIGFDAARLQTLNPGAYSGLPKNATLAGALSFYYTFDGELRATNGTVTYAWTKGDYNVKRKRFAYSWTDATARVGKSR
jgi:hypothetical protein